MTALRSLVWLRQDLRLSDNPALHAAVKRGEVLPIYVLSQGEEGDWPLGGAARWWLHQSLRRLARDFRQAADVQLTLRRGNSLECLQELLTETGATAVYWNRRYEPAALARDQQIKQTLTAQGIEVQSFNASLLFEPWEVENKQGRPFQVFTPFWKHCLSRNVEHDPLPLPSNMAGPSLWPDSDRLEDWHLEPSIPWDRGLRANWTVGSAAAKKMLQRFAAENAAEYKENRDQMSVEGTSRLSPYLRFGEISPREIWAEIRAAQAAGSNAPSGVECYLSEIGWREFGYHLLYHFPETTKHPLRKKFDAFPWKEDALNLRCWQKGQTGYPVVDAAMRQLWQTGWMHNRARMIVASFLCKHLLLPWQRGAEWFWDTLVDADLASNTQGWQWSAGCGADAAPYFRIFNPIIQGKKFDPAGQYIRHWVPELTGLPNKWLYQPWEAPADVLAAAGVQLGKNYPQPIVDHATARQAALDAYAAIKK